MFETEKWLPIAGFEGIYEVSDFGRVKSVDRIITEIGGRQRHKRGKFIKPHTNHKGYQDIALSYGGAGTIRKAHRLVAEAFVPNPLCKPQINHKDGDKLNNTPSNLEWVTFEENAQHAYENGLRKVDIRSKQIIATSLDGNIVLKFDSTMAAERCTGVHNDIVSRCCKGLRESAGGLIWRYLNNADGK